MSEVVFFRLLIFVSGLVAGWCAHQYKMWLVRAKQLEKQLKSGPWPVDMKNLKRRKPQMAHFEGPESLGDDDA